MDPATTSSATPRAKSPWPMFVGAFVLFGLFAVAVQWMRTSSDTAAFDEEAIRAKQRYEILAKVIEENNGLTTKYAWADRAKGTVRLPVDRAMELTVAKLAAQGEPKPAYPVDPTIPLGSALKPGGLAAPQPTPPPFARPPAPTPEPAPPAPEVPAPVDPAPPVPSESAAPAEEVGP
jgi:hypothetical protein